MTFKTLRYNSTWELRDLVLTAEGALVDAVEALDGNCEDRLATELAVAIEKCRAVRLVLQDRRAREEES